MQLGLWGYVGAFATSLMIAWILTPLALRFATKRGFLDHPAGYKIQDLPVPYLGGAAIATSFAIVILIATLINPPPSGVGQLSSILLVAIGLCLVGLFDDLRTLAPPFRFVAEIAAGILMWLSGVQVLAFDVEAANLLLTILWIVGITNAFNLLDNMDGLSAGLAAIASLFFFLIAAINGQYLVAGLSIALAGCALGFLRHNLHPARIYMGDAGSLFLGFTLAVIGIKLRFDAPPQITFMVPILVLGVAIFDTTLVVLTRLVHRLNPFIGGRDHISHRLVFVGISVPASVALIYGASISLGWLAIVMSRVDVGTGFILMGLVFSITIFLGLLLASVPVYETSRRQRIMIQKVQTHDEPDNVDVAV